MKKKKKHTLQIFELLLLVCWVVADKLGFQLEFIYVHNWTEIHKIHARKFNLYKKISKTSFHA